MKELTRKITEHIDDCCYCAFCTDDLICAVMGKEIDNDLGIPDWCPLPDSSEKEPTVNKRFS